MNQTEAVVKALEILGGRSELKWITLIALHMDDVCWTKAKEPSANIRRIVRTTPKQILVLGNGWYELSQHRKEIETNAAEIADLKEERDKLAKMTIEKVVGYAKDLHDYNDAKPIVAMLNKLYRKIATEEELAQIDSIEILFKQRDIPQQKPNVGGDNSGIMAGGNIGVTLSPKGEDNLVKGLLGQNKNT